MVKDVYPAALLAGTGARPQDGLKLFRSMLMLQDTTERSEKSPEAFLARYVGVKDATVRDLVRLSTTSSAQEPPWEAGQVLEQVEDLVRRAARMLARREQDKVVEKAVWDQGLDGVELRFGDVAAVEDLFFLARYDPPKEVVASLDRNPLRPLPLLAQGDAFWRVALLVVIISGSNPATVGRWAWQKCPTLRSLMQMVVCSQFQFPPPGAQGLADKMVEADGDMGDEEAALTSLLRGEERRARGSLMSSLKKRKLKVMAAGPRRASSQAGGGPGAEIGGEGNNKANMRLRSQMVRASDEERRGEKKSVVPDLIFLNLCMQARRPPNHVLEELKALDKELGMGARYGGDPWRCMPYANY